MKMTNTHTNTHTHTHTKNTKSNPCATGEETEA